MMGSLVSCCEKDNNLDPSADVGKHITFQLGFKGPMLVFRDLTLQDPIQLVILH